MLYFGYAGEDPRITNPETDVLEPARGRASVHEALSELCAALDAAEVGRALSREKYLRAAHVASVPQREPASDSAVPPTAVSNPAIPAFFAGVVAGRGRPVNMTLPSANPTPAATAIASTRSCAAPP